MIDARHHTDTLPSYGRLRLSEWSDGEQSVELLTRAFFSLKALGEDPLSKTAKSKPDFTAVYERLKAIMKQHESDVFKGGPYGERPNSYCLVGPPSKLTHGKPAWFGAVVLGKAYVSYHLIPVYIWPDLLESASPELKKHMQGKSCFNFKSVDEKLLKEITKVTAQSFERFKAGV